jgi:hypothetical protein
MERNAHLFKVVLSEPRTRPKHFAHSMSAGSREHEVCEQMLELGSLRPHAVSKN